MLHIRIASRYRACIHPCIRCIFQKNTVAGIIRNIDGAYRTAIAARYTKETATAIARIHFGAGHIGTIVIRHPECGIATAIVVVATGYSTHRTIATLIQQHGTTRVVVRSYIADVKAV